MMQLYIAGVPSGYELEHVARLFYPFAQMCKRYPSARIAGAKNAVIVRVSRRRIVCGVRLTPTQATKDTNDTSATPLQGTFVTMQLREGELSDKKVEYAVALSLYQLLCRVSGICPPWGMLTGVRPVRLVHDMRRAGKQEAEIARFFCEDYRVQPPKYALASTIANVQTPILRAAACVRRPYSLYLSIPFCPSRCSYCSFVSRTTAQSKKLIAPYLERLCEEVRDIAQLAARNALTLQSIYIGGGTPTALSALQLQALMETVRQCFDLSQVREYTVEAGRPDCTTQEKLSIIKEYGANRISINPQTLSDAVLQNIGRRHSAQDIIDCFADARAVGHTNINMDLIAGLPQDTLEGFVQSLSGVMALHPENITVHTLTLKRASNLVIEHERNSYGDTAAMVEASQRMLADHYAPYYLYRQKGTLGNLENTGYTKHGFAGLYNIYIMEEVHTILSAGAGGSTKLVTPHGGKITRIFNHKYPLEYLERFDVVKQRKQGVDSFYGQFIDLDSQTSR